MTTFVTDQEHDRAVRDKIGRDEFARRIALHREAKDRLTAWCVIHCKDSRDEDGEFHSADDNAFALLCFYGSRFRWMLLNLNADNADKFAAAPVEQQMSVVDRFIRKGMLA